MRGRLPAAWAGGLGPGGLRTVLVIGALSAAKAVALVMIAESLAVSIAAIAGGSAGWRSGVLLGAGLLGAIGALLRAGSTWAIGTIAAREATTAKTRIRGELAEWIADDDGDSGLEAGSAAVLATSGVDDLDDYYGSVIPAAVAAVVVPVVLGARILSLDWLSAVVIAITLPLVPLFMALIGMHTRQRTDAASRALHRLADHLVELAHGLPVLVGLGRVDEQTDALAGIQSELRRRTSLTLRTAFLSALALELIGTLSVAVVAVLLGIRLMNGDVPLATALVVLLLTPECFGVVREVGAAFHASQNGTSALRRVTGLLATAPRVRRPAPGRDVVVAGLTVRYPRRGAAAIDGLTAEFRRGELSAVVGPSGAGKSTLLAALAGTLDRDAELCGSVRGVDPSRLALAAQAPHFFGATLDEELGLATDDRREVDAVLDELDLTALRGRRPSQLSPGEARRLAVARAALRVRSGATTALFDEPTAHLDDVNARRVRGLLVELTRSAAVIVVTHDPALIERADAVVRVPEPARAPATATPALAADARRAATPSDNNPSDDTRPGATPPAGTQPAGSTLGALLSASPGCWALAVLLGVAATGFGLALTAVSAWLIVRAAEHPEIMYLLVAIVGVRFFGLGRSVARYAERLVTHGAIMSATDELRLRIWRGIAARGAGSRRLQEGGAAVDYLVTSLDEVRDLVPRVVTPLAVGALSLAGVVTTVALMDPAVAPWIGAALVLAGVVVPWLVRRGDAAASSGRVAVRAELGERITALAGASRELRANGMSQAAVARVRAEASRLALLDRRAARSAGRGTALLTLVTCALAALVPLLAMSVGMPSGAAPAASPSAETVAVIALLSLAAFEPLADATRAVQRAPRLVAVLARLRPFLERPDRPDGHRSITAPLAAVELDGLAARWPGTATEVFHGLDARIDAGRWLVVDGPSGSGKTTLLTLLLGELTPDAGSILVDGVPLTAVRRDHWRERVAWCPQEAHVFDSTIRANLLIARPRTDAVSDGEMHQVLARVGLASLLERTTDGLDARVGTSGASLSGGERQRLAVARALLGRSELLLLDEPTAHLDEPTAAAMMADIRTATRDRLVVLVSHRPADRAPSDHTLQLGARTGADQNESVAA